MFETILDGNQINIFIALLAGTVTFFASCLLPLVPTYLAYLSGLTLQEDEASESDSQRRIFLNGLAFTIGFIAIFVLLGLIATTIGQFLSSIRPLIQRVGGVLFVTMGLLMLGVYTPNWLTAERKLEVTLFDRWKHWQYLHSFLVGIVFGFAWTPCIGPVLGVILFWAAHAESAVRGMLLLLSYGIGLGIPFLIVAIGFQRIAPYLQKTKRIGHILNILAAIIIIIMGILLFFDKAQLVSMWLIRQLGLIQLAA